ncbi:MAG: metallophosphoesterase [Chloroflexi bacterium]|nr:metallophosphoesterase [Chloroflexota bacterium]
MRIAILADIHGNLPAFEAVLQHVHQQKVDQLVIAGDLINGAPDSALCWQLAQTVPCLILRGNHERYIFDFGLPHAPAVWQTERFAPVQWTAAQFTDAERHSFRKLPFAIRPPAAPDLLIVHASLRRDNDLIAAYTPEAELPEMFPNSLERYIVRGHEHWCQVRLWGDRTIITTGSVGWALDENQATAQYLILEQHANRWSIHHQAVPYDVNLTVQRFHTTGYLKETGPMGRLMLREIATASSQIVPFLRIYERWFLEEPLSLAAGVERFFKLY